MRVPHQTNGLADSFELDRYALRGALRERGLVVLEVGEHRANPEVLTVYLHGLAGQWNHGAAEELIRSVPGVVAVTESVSTPTILLVRIARHDHKHPSNRPTPERGGDAAG